MYRAVKGIYENGQIKLMEDIGVKKANVVVLVIDDNKDLSFFDWDPLAENEKSAFSKLTANSIKEWQNAEEDNIWK
ncbi:MAG: hypothetical protein QMC67_14340 [Candidatus Wallbacteria bacterium]